MKTVRQLFLGLLFAFGSTLIVLAAASLSLLEGNGSAVSAIPATVTVTPPSITVSPLPLENPVQNPSPTQALTPTVTQTELVHCSNTPADWLPYMVQDGDTLDSLAARAGLSTEEYMKANCFSSATIPLQPGLIMYLPPTVPTATPTVTPTVTETETPTPVRTSCGAPPGWIMYTVKPGDTLFKLSVAFGVSQSALMNANCMSSTTIYYGLQIHVPNRPTITPAMTDTPEPPTETATETPTVTETPTKSVTTTVPSTATPVTPTPDYTPTKQTAKVTLGTTTFTYDGKQHPVDVTTDPPNLTVTVLYDGSPTAPTNAAEYTVAATVVDPKYQGSATGKLTINKAKINITLNDLVQTYDGNPKGVTVTTDPQEGVTVAVTYNGSETKPTNAGSYTVVVTATVVNNTNYDGNTATGTLIINKADQTINFTQPIPSQESISNSPIPVSATASSGLTVTLAAIGDCSLSGGKVTLITVGGTCKITATQSGNENYNQAQKEWNFNIVQ